MAPLGLEHGECLSDCATSVTHIWLHLWQWLHPSLQEEQQELRERQHRGENPYRAHGFRDSVVDAEVSLKESVSTVRLNITKVYKYICRANSPRQRSRRQNALSTLIYQQHRAAQSFSTTCACNTRTTLGQLVCVCVCVCVCAAAVSGAVDADVGAAGCVEATVDVGFEVVVKVDADAVFEVVEERGAEADVGADVAVCVSVEADVEFGAEAEVATGVVDAGVGADVAVKVDVVVVVVVVVVAVDVGVDVRSAAGVFAAVGLETSGEA
ncbi:unnamed protein product [Phytophthora lilii]|uniref:Unnamed protein product n=1 Tax=Phytophthora lilii TaxID=2077276 RepID=A0A9W6UBE3_9STRA|nr:unnamed protein product [Phytophthora lilii]